MTRANEKADEGGALVPVDVSPMPELFRGFDESLAWTPENVQSVVEKVAGGARFVGVIATDFVLWGGRALLWMRRHVDHGDWLPFLQEHFPRLPPRTAQRWMAEAKYCERHGRRKCATLSHFGDDDPALDDPELDERLADPEAEVESYADLRRERDRLKKQKAALINRDVQSQEALREREDEITRLKEGDPWEAERKRCPIRFLLARAQLAVGEAAGLIAQATEAELVRQGDGDVRVLGATLSAIQRAVEELIIEHKHRLGGSVESHADGD